MKICVSLTDETTEAVIERMEELAGIADLFEIRADLVLDLDLLTILRGDAKPLLLTCRSVSEGGRWPDDDPRRRLTLLEASSAASTTWTSSTAAAYLDVRWRRRPRARRLLPRPRAARPRTSTRSTRDGRPGRRHREDRGHARARSPTWGGCWPSRDARPEPAAPRWSPSPWARWA